MYKDQRGKKGKSLENDKSLLVPLFKLMDEADIILGQNSNAFDIKKINSKLLEHGLGVPSPYKKIDTYLLAKKHFSLTSNKLEYMSKKFNVKYKKQEHEEFSGFKLWDECLKGNLKAWKSMERYNNFDVLATEELFLKIAQFDKTEVVTSALRAYRNKK
jgi:DNA polymerase III epsilon subunit-like protein